MASLSYDSNKLPLGKLSKDTISRGYSTLKEISEVLKDPATAPQRFPDIGSTFYEIVAVLTSRYYTVIPHNFGRYTPPVIDTVAKLKKETELVETLSDMKIASQIMSEHENTHALSPEDAHYQSLGLNETTVRTFPPVQSSRRRPI